MTEAFQMSRQSLLLLLDEYPSKDDIECLLRITPNGIAKINSDLIQRRPHHQIMKDLSVSLQDYKALCSKLPDEKKEHYIDLTYEQIVAMEWGGPYSSSINTKVEDYLLSIVFEYRKYRINQETRIRYNGERLLVSHLVSTQYSLSTDYVILKNTLAHSLLTLNPMFLWFDHEIKIDNILNSIYQNCQVNSPPIFNDTANDGTLEFPTSASASSVSTKRSFDSLHSPSASKQSKRVRFSVQSIDVEDDTEEINNAIEISEKTNVHVKVFDKGIIKQERKKSKNSEGIIYKINSYFNKILNKS